MFIERRFYIDREGRQFSFPTPARPGSTRRRAGAERKRLLKEGVSALVLAERERRGWRLSSEKVLEVFALDIELNAQGLEFWLDSEGK